jgi:transcriptional regulator with XRE-family HTH domain
MDQFQQLGARFRAVRIRRGWRQTDVGGKVGLSASIISRIERGHIERIQLGTILAVARALDIQITITTRSRGADLDRLVSGRHAGLHESVARWFAEQLPDWILAPEVSFSIHGERGIIDILAWHPAHRALVIIELKTDIVDVNELIGRMDQRRRLAARIAEDRGWHPLTISVWVIVANGRTNRARLSAHRTLLRNAFPMDGRSVLGWLRRPDRRIAALSLWDRVEHGIAAGAFAARHRVRRRAVRPASSRKHEGLAPGARNGRLGASDPVREPIEPT